MALHRLLKQLHQKWRAGSGQAEGVLPSSPIALHQIHRLVGQVVADELRVHVEQHGILVKGAGLPPPVIRPVAVQFAGGINALHPHRIPQVL